MVVLGGWRFLMSATRSLQQAPPPATPPCSFKFGTRPRGKETGILLPNNQRQHRTSHAPKDVLPYAYVLIAVPRVSRSCEHFPDGFDLGSRTHPSILALSRSI